MRADAGSAPASAIVLREYPFVYPDDPLELAIARFKQSPGVVPVVSRTAERRVEGAITLGALLAFLGQHPLAVREVEAGPFNMLERPGEREPIPGPTRDGT